MKYFNIYTPICKHWEEIKKKIIVPVAWSKKLNPAKKRQAWLHFKKTLNNLAEKYTSLAGNEWKQKPSIHKMTIISHTRTLKAAIKYIHPEMLQQLLNVY